MQQSTLEIDGAPRLAVAELREDPGFDIGWDHAHHALVPPAELLLEGTPIGQGWRAGRNVFRGRTLTATRHTRQWLALRILAWRQGLAFDTQQVTPHYLAQLAVDRCPVLRTPLGGAPGQPDAAVIERLNPAAGYAAGNLAMMSQRAAQARQGVALLEAVRRARRAERRDEAVEGLEAGAWWRVAALASYATPLPFHDAASLPLAVLPPNRVRLLNVAQGLQALVTVLFMSPGWSSRTRALAQCLPEHTVRHDFNLFVGAVAPRVLEAGTDTDARRRALEAAWLLERVQRRWQHFVLSLGEVATEALLKRASDQGLAGVRTLTQNMDQATEGWALAQGGRATAPRAPAAAPWRPTSRPAAAAARLASPA